MLVLTRKPGQGFLIGDQVEVTILETSGEKVRIAVQAPREVPVLRKELAEAGKANMESVLTALPDRKELSEIHNALMRKEEK